VIVGKADRAGSASAVVRYGEGDRRLGWWICFAPSGDRGGGCGYLHEVMGRRPGHVEVAVEENSVSAEGGSGSFELVADEPAGSLNHVGRSSDLTVGAAGRGACVIVAVLGEAGLGGSGGQSLDRYPSAAQQRGQSDGFDRGAERLGELCVHGHRDGDGGDGELDYVAGHITGCGQTGISFEEAHSDETGRCLLRRRSTQVIEELAPVAGDDIDAFRSGGAAGCDAYRVDDWRQQQNPSDLNRRARD
jgi:hypothetical protein